MNDARLQQLYRRLTAKRDEALDADALVEAMGRAGYPDAEDTTLDRIAASAAHADVLRTVLELGPEAQALSRELNVARQSRRVAVPARRWMALAAALGAVALLVVGLRPDAPQAPIAAEAPLSEQIFSVSFEDAVASPQAQILTGSFETSADRAPGTAEIFTGDFDS